MSEGHGSLHSSSSTDMPFVIHSRSWRSLFFSKQPVVLLQYFALSLFPLSQYVQQTLGLICKSWREGTEVHESRLRHSHFLPTILHRHPLLQGCDSRLQRVQLGRELLHLQGVMKAR